MTKHTPDPRDEYRKLSPYARLDNAYQELMEGYGERGRRIETLETALKQILEGASGNAGRCMDCDSVVQVAYHALHPEEETE